MIIGTKVNSKIAFLLIFKIKNKKRKMQICEYINHEF